MAKPVSRESPVMPAHEPHLSGPPSNASIQVIDTQKVLVGILLTQLDALTRQTRELRAQVVGLLDWRRPAPSGLASLPLYLCQWRRRPSCAGIWLLLLHRRWCGLHLGFCMRLPTPIHAPVGKNMILSQVPVRPWRCAIAKPTKPRPNRATLAALGAASTLVSMPANSLLTSPMPADARPV